MKLRWSRAARDDLVSLREFIGTENPRAAREIAERILAAVAQLADHPASGRPGRVVETRELVVAETPLLIAYRVRDGAIQLLRVLHGARRWPRRL